MKLRSERLRRFIPELVFPFGILAAASNQVAASVCEDEFKGLIEKGAVYGTGSRARVKTIRFVSQDAENGHFQQAIEKSSPTTRAIPSVDLERSEEGCSSYVMRRWSEQGLLIKDPSFKRAA